MKKIKIHCSNNNKTKEYLLGTPIIDIGKDLFSDMHIIGALVNNNLKNMDYEVYKPKTVQFLDSTSIAGMDIYERTLCFVLHVAVKELYPHEKIHIEHEICNGIYCRFANKQIVLSSDDVAKIKQRMQEIIDSDDAIVREEIPTEKALELFAQQGLFDKVDLLKNRGKLYTSVYKLRGEINYYYNVLAPSTGCLNVFDLQDYYQGMLLFLPELNNPNKVREFHEQPQKFVVVNEFKRWGKFLDVTNISELNELTKTQDIGELIKISEALQEKKISQIADQIHHKRKRIKVVLIAGPSSSGKTTFSKRLSVQLKACGLKPVNLSTDSYFLNREKTPRLPNGEYDFETIDAVDLKAFNSDLKNLLEGKEIELPKFSFEKGERYYDGEKMSVSKKNVIIIEGIHGLNPRLTEMIDDRVKYKIYISPLTAIVIDRDNRIPGYENRLIRRIIRDYRYRSYSATETIDRWESVRIGEEKHIFPFLNEADMMFNSALPYELGVFKQYAEPMLREVNQDCVAYSEAQRLLKFFEFIEPISSREIPPTSLLREFLGGSSFSYK